MTHQTYRIVLCGTVHSGKTHCFECLKQRIHPNAQAHVYFAEEASTHVMRNTELHHRKNPLSFQAAVLKQQYENEDTLHPDFEDIPSVIICDRGTPDAFVYLNDSDARSIVGHDLTDTLARYHLSLYFHPYQPEPDNIKGNNSFRYESFDELERLEEKTFEIWKQHRNRFDIDTFPNFNDKVDFVCSLINKVIGYEIFT